MLANEKQKANPTENKYNLTLQSHKIKKKNQKETTTDKPINL